VASGSLETTSKLAQSSLVVTSGLDVIVVSGGVSSMPTLNV
jgi:hypothetical protein